MLILLIFSLFLYIGHSIVCPSTSPYLLVSTSTCYAVCPWSSTSQYYGNPNDMTCKVTCDQTWFGFDGNKTCTQTCPTYPTMTFYDDVNNKCVNKCPANYFSYLGATVDNQKCLTVCPSGTFAQQTQRTCVSVCPSNTFYKNDTVPKCVIRCNDNFYANPINKNCVQGGSCPISPVRYYADDTTNLCVLTCSINTFADIFTGRCLVYCSINYFSDRTTWKCVQNCPLNYYRSNVTRSCLAKCTQGYFIDKISGNCTQTCTSNTFGDSTTRFCQPQCTYPLFADSIVGRCVLICSLGYYSNNFTSSCVTAINCYSNHVADPTTRKCVQPINCPTIPYHYANIVSKICVLKCPIPLWGDKSTKSCVSVCPWNPGMYYSWKNPDTRQCVTQCPQYPILYADNYTQTCIAQCPTASVSIPYDTFADDISQTCVRTCPNGFSGQKPQQICVSQCSSTPIVLFFYTNNASCISSCPQGYYADFSKQLCVIQCPTSPQYFAYDNNNTCMQQCPDGTYADRTTRKCQIFCSQKLLQYADNSTNQCVDKCPIDPQYYGLDDIDGNRKCVFICPIGLFADPLTRTCVSKCNIFKGYYGQLLTPIRKCVLQCPSNKFADNTTATCVSKCPNTPTKYYGNRKTKKCEFICPQFLYGNSITNLCGQPTQCQTGFFADDSRNLCVRTCPVLQQTYGQSTSRRCLKSCPNGKYADNTTRKCQTGCNITAKLYKDSSTNRCVYKCPSIPNLYNNPLTMSCDQQCTGNYFAYDGQRKCVINCPSTPALYANLQTFRCVSTCPRQRYSFANNTYRACLPYCPTSYLGDLYADNTTWSCVKLCPRVKNLFSFKHPTDTTIRTCVLTCPVLNDITFYFADSVSQSCVRTCPLRNLTWGDKYTLKCQKTCTRQQYRDNVTNLCSYVCSSPNFADNTTFRCVKQCPVGLFGNVDSANRTCLKYCPNGTYADNKTRTCRSLCDNDIALWSDNTTWTCVKVCPIIPDLYADPFSDKCQFNCSNDLFADKFKRKCVTALECSNATIGDPRTFRCIEICPIQVPSFHEQATNTCKEQCQPGFYADNSTMKCQAICSSIQDFYAHNDTTLGPICVLYCPASHYKFLPQRTCVTSCPSPNYYKDTTTMQCVLTCPDHYYAQSIGQICVSNCSINSKYGLNNICYDNCTGLYNMDMTTYLCVLQCPLGYFAQENICKSTCDIGYADPITKKCQPTICSLGYFVQTGTNLCVLDCQPEYKLDSNKRCSPTCPHTALHTTNLYMDNNTYECVNKCLPGQYADNNTRYCDTVCSAGLFADNSTGRCVSKCPLSPDYYGYQNVCYFPCPTPGIYAQNLTRECLPICPSGSYADDYNLRCMDFCTMKKYKHQYPDLIDNTIIHRVCVQMCPQGFYALDTNHSCVTICPDGLYGQNDTNKCIMKCPNGQFADDFLNLCVSACSATRNQFKDWTTNACVTTCPSVPSLYAQISSRSCVNFCQPTWYGYNQTRQCRQSCPSPYYADPSTGFCQAKCFIGAYRFADNISRSCVSNCPNYTDPITNNYIITYEDNSTKTCVIQCPIFPFSYGYDLDNQCVFNCPPGTYGDNDTRRCLIQCQFDVIVNGVKKYTWADPTTDFCVKRCPTDWYADNYTKTCTQFCTIGTFAQNSTNRCIFMCLTNPLSFANTQTRRCVYACEDGYFGDQLSRTCETKCPTQPYYYYKDYVKNRCTKICPTGYFGDKLTQSCNTDCIVGYYKSLSLRLCMKCPSSCYTCLAELNCTSCKQGLYLHQGQCISTCPSFPIQYYINTQSVSCVSQCITPYFGFIGTGRCQLNCPQTYFSDLTDNTCKSCDTGCRRCVNTKNCTSCLRGYVFVSEMNTCSKICNSTHIYYVDGKCSNKCVDGTFLLADLVNCQKCSTTCSACSGSGSNCTRCASKFWYNYNCVDKCPDTYYVDGNNSCQQCKINVDACKVDPLTYTIQPFTKNYKLFAYIKFNRAVNLTVSQFNKIVIIQTQKGPIKSSSYIVSIFNQRTFLISFLESKSLNQLALSIGFLPGSVVDTYGNGLIQSTDLVQLATLQTVSEQIQIKSQNIKNDVNTFSWFLVALLIVMAFKCSYPLIVLIDFLQIMYMHIFVQITPLPYMWMNVMSVLENTHFAFLPKFYEQISESVVNPYYLFKKDITFLGNLQPLFFLAIVFLIIYGIFWFLSKTKISFLKPLRRKSKRLFKERMKYSFFNEIFYYTQLYVVYFAIFQWSANRSSVHPVINLAVSILAVTLYVAWCVFLVYKSAHYRKRLQTSKIPRRYSFLLYQPSKFPMDIALRYALKLFIPVCLLINEKSIQLILLMILNLTYLLFNLIYSPAIQKTTNYVNIIVSAGFIVYEILLFVYGITEKTSDNQLFYSYALFIVAGIVLIFILGWILHRFVRYFKQEIWGVSSSKNKQIYNDQDQNIDEKAQKHFNLFNWNKNKQQKTKNKSKYNRFSQIQKSMIDQDDKNIIHQLQFKNDQEQPNSDDQQSMDVDVAMNQFSYHLIPKKNQIMIKAEQEILAKMQNKIQTQNRPSKLSKMNKKSKTSKNFRPMVISIDQNELLDKNLQILGQQSSARKIKGKGSQSLENDESRQSKSVSRKYRDNFSSNLLSEQSVVARKQQNKVIWDENQVRYQAQNLGSMMNSRLDIQIQDMSSQSQSQDDNKRRKLNR